MRIVIEGVPPWDGPYDFDSLAFTNRENHRIKEISGTRAGEILDELQAGDSGTWVAVAAIVMARHGVTVELDDLWGATMNAFDFFADADADPPLPPNAGPNGNTALSGASSVAAGV